MEYNLKVTSSPHVRSLDTTAKTMIKVIIAMLPICAASIYFFGIRALVLICVSVASSVLFEFLYNIVTKQEQTIGDFSAVITGMLLAFNVPSTLPIYMMILGAFFAIIVTKMLFGGLGHNFANPAIAGRVILLTSFGQAMTKWVAPRGAVDALATATPLGGGEATYLELFLGQIGGSLGETSALAILIGFVILLVLKVIPATVPLVYIGTTAIFTLVLGLDPIYHILSGGLMLGAVFMATDYSSSPYTPWGRVVFGIGCGLVTVLIRVYGGYPEGVSFAILFMNLLTPLIERWTIPAQFGYKQSKAKSISLYAFICLVALMFVGVGINTIIKPSEEERITTDEQIETAIGAGFERYSLKSADIESGVTEAYIGAASDAFLVQTTGFNQNDKLIFLITIDKAGAVQNIEIVQNNDTPEFGGKINDPAYLQTYVGATTESVGSVELMSGATVTSTAAKKAVESALTLSQTMGGE